MPSIDEVVQVGDTDPSGAGSFVVTVTPDDAEPGHGIVRDTRGHSADWDSPAGDPVKVLIHGVPPFRALQFQMTTSKPAHASSPAAGFGFSALPRSSKVRVPPRAKRKRS
jgi:hypothetical protein